jgi:hypothetical protein
LQLVNTNALFVRLISHQPAVLFCQNKSAISNQPAVLFSQNKPAPAISHQRNEQAAQLISSLSALLINGVRSQMYWLISVFWSLLRA